MVLFVCLFQFFVSFQISLFFCNIKVLFYWITLVSITILSSMILFIFFPSVVFNFNCFSCSVYCFDCCVCFFIQCSHFFILLNIICSNAKHCRVERKHAESGVFMLAILLFFVFTFRSAYLINFETLSPVELTNCKLTKSLTSV